MKTDLTQDQIESYQNNGYVVIDDFLTTDELNHWRECVDEAVAKRANYRFANEGGAEDPDNYYTNVFIQRVNLWQDNDDMRVLMLDARLGKMATELSGEEGIRIWHDQALIKQPWGNPTGWHLDNPYWSFSSCNAISLWVALDDATHDNGCLYFIPGTHKTATFDNTDIGQNIGDLFSVYTDWASMDSVAAPMKAGSCSFHNGLLAHGAGANMTPGYRRAMTCAYMPDGSTFNGTKNILSDEQVAKLNVGDVLDDDSQSPLIYHKSKPYLS
jgi:phytanoyl-CoA hydroxylase